MRSTKGLVMEILSSMENDEIYEECLSAICADRRR
jgi:hypothetical protein